MNLGPATLPTAPSIAARLERLPLCGFHRRFVSIVSIGAWYYFFDLFAVAYIGAALQNSHFLTLMQFSYLVSAGFVGMFIGTLVQGMGSDYLGRRTAFVTMLLVYSAFSLAGAFANTARVLI